MLLLIDDCDDDYDGEWTDGRTDGWMAGWLAGDDGDGHVNDVTVAMTFSGYKLVVVSEFVW